jgi:uncharacterized protein YigA (DUF484 family)
MESNHRQLHKTLEVTSNPWQFFDNLKKYTQDVALAKASNDIIERGTRQKKSLKQKNEKIEKNLKKLLEDSDFNIELFLAIQARERCHNDRFSFSEF